MVIGVGVPALSGRAAVWLRPDEPAVVPYIGGLGLLQRRRHQRGCACRRHVSFFVAVLDSTK
jgi:hypothetical protein